MTHPKDTVGDYVRQVRESTQQYAKDLLAENEKLLGTVQALGVEHLSMQQEIEALRGQLERQREAEQSLVAQVSEMESTRRELSLRYVDVEQSNTNLANLYVASYGLHQSLERPDVVRSIHEVLVNLIGSEEFALLERTSARGPFGVSSSMGLDAAQIARIRCDAGTIGHALRQGTPHVVDPAAPRSETYEPDAPTACIPLSVGGRVRGAIVVFRLLPHKPRLEPIDGELFELLATHAASALHCCDLHARLREQEALEAAQ